MALLARITAVYAGSIAAEIGLLPGDSIKMINGVVPEDLIDMSFQLADENIELLVEKANGTEELFEIEKSYDDMLGVEFESAVFDGVKKCHNKCIFCFVDQMPKGQRKTLYIKDDDYRLSFLYGNFVTLTNLQKKDIQRITRLNLSPIYVSVHTTNGKLRSEMMGTPKAAHILEQLQQLFEAGISVHTQVVLCPGYNDGEELERTIQELFLFSPQVLSLAIVPVGLTRYREKCAQLEPVSPQMANQLINQVTKWQEQYRGKTGTSFVHLADEFYLLADRSIPEYDKYDDFPQLENGIGLVRCFWEEWKASQINTNLARNKKIFNIVCGTSFAKILPRILEESPALNGRYRIIAAPNVFFGNAVSVSGLLVGKDIAEAVLKEGPMSDGVIIPGTALRKGENIFLDGMTLPELSELIGGPVFVAHSAEELYLLLIN